MGQILEIVSSLARIRRGGRSSGRTSFYLCEYWNKHGHDVTWCYYAPYDASYTMPSPYGHNYSTAHHFPYSYASSVHAPTPHNSDSGATNHLTADPSLLADLKEQFASYHIYMGNGHKASISCCGNAYFQSPFDPNVSMSLHNLLLVSTI
ncbi:hypothetical protein Lal_00031847 [Lupinus albus]|nr:hypothetical protein Lal_00031847 [Lupinus albus]